MPRIAVLGTAFDLEVSLEQIAIAIGKSYGRRRCSANNSPAQSFASALFDADHRATGGTTMKLELHPIPTDDPGGPAGPPGMRTQRSGRVVAVLDGDAHLHAWEPNGDADRIDIDLTKAVALVIDRGLDAPPAPEPHWAGSDDSVTVIVSLEVGVDGAITVDGHRVSEAAAVNLAAAGFLRLLRDAVGRESPRADDGVNDAADTAPPADADRPSDRARPATDSKSS